MNDTIFIKGAREHNLQNIDIEIPRNKLIVFTGLSGSGKSSLAFDTIYAEGQRRYVESLSSYARQFLGQMEKPDIDYITGLSPAISIDQKTTSRNPRSTVGTVTEVYDYLRLLYARAGIPHCPKCGKVIQRQTVDQMVDRIMMLPEGTRMQLLSPVVRARKGEHVKLFEDLLKNGYVRARVDGEIYELSQPPKLAKTKVHTIEVVIDRLIRRDGMNQRLSDSLETSLALSGGLVIIDIIDGEEMLFSQNYACPDCNISIEELAPRMFSFNSPFGACPECSGLGMLMKIDRSAIVPDESLSINQGALEPSGWNMRDEESYSRIWMNALAQEYKFSLDTPFGKLPKSATDVVLYGSKDKKIKVDFVRNGKAGSFTAPFEGIITNLERRYRDTNSSGMREFFEELMINVPCPECGGKRLKKEALSVTIGDTSISDVCEMAIVDSRKFFEDLTLTPTQAIIARQILKEINARLGFLMDVGLEYLTLARASGSLSGGEAQRIRLATQIGSSLVGVLYILDEPSIGLHQRDNARLLATLKSLRDLGNTLIVVEHDEETMYAADYIVDIGPGAGINGGHIVAMGTVDEIKNHPASITGTYLSGRKKIHIPKRRREKSGELIIRGARENNLKNIDAAIPLGVMTCITGVSGSGKSSLINEILYKALARDLNRAKTRPGKYDNIEGIEQLDKIIAIDQSPIGTTPRSNPSTYTGMFDLIRKLYAQTPDAKARGFSANRFSFNVKGGRCEACSGNGINKIEMHFLADIYVPCEVCKGKKYNRETLEVMFHNKNIFDVLDMTVDEAVEFFKNHRQIMRKLETLSDVGLGYIKLGQPSTTLSGGEAQRVKLATELSRPATGRTVYVLDEPTTGLHIADVDKLIDVLQRLTDAGNTVIVIEHNLDVIKTADHIIDLGPEGGDRGGIIIAQGTPEEICECGGSYTGKYLRRALIED